MLPKPTSAEWPLSRIHPGTNSRKPLPERIKELRASIDQHGLLQPPGVIDRADDNLAFGFQRYYAHLIEPVIQTVRVMVFPATITPIQVKLANATENLTRTDLTEVETYLLCKELLTLEPNWRRQDLAAHLSKSGGWVTQVLAVDDCVPEVMATFLAGQVSRGKVYDLSKERPEDQLAMLAAGGTREDRKRDRQKRRNGDKPEVKASTTKCPLPSGALVTVSGQELALDGLIDALGMALKEAKRAQENGLDIKTFAAVARDKSRAGN